MSFPEPSINPSIHPPQPSPTSAAASTTSVSAPTTTNQASTVSPPFPSTASSVSSPLAAPGPAFHHHGYLHPHPGGAGAGIPSSSSSSAAAGPAAQQQQPPAQAPLNATLPSPSSQRQVAEARTALVASIGNMLDSELRGRAAVLHASDAAIGQQERDVARATDGLHKENERLARVAADAARQVKELGNVQNWAEVLEREFLVLEETVRLVREGSEGSWSGSRSGSSFGSGSASREGSVAGPGLEDGDGDARMEDPAGDRDAASAQRADKGKAVDRYPTDGMDVDMPTANNAQRGGAIADGPALKIPDVDVPGVSIRRLQAPTLNIPRRELSNIGQASLEDELRSAMDQQIGEPTTPLMGSS